jgi:transcriptional regulator GlxA family with amidase domain
VTRVVFLLVPQVHLLDLAGPAQVFSTASDMEAPYELVYARRNGSGPQASVLLRLRHRAHLSDVVHRAQELIDSRFTERIPLAGLAADCGVSPRTPTRMFTDATGLTPLRYQHLLRLERAEHLLGHGATVESAARAAGFDDPRMLRRLRSRTG